MSIDDVTAWLQVIFISSGLYIVAVLGLIYLWASRARQKALRRYLFSQLQYEPEYRHREIWVSAGRRRTTTEMLLDPDPVCRRATAANYRLKSRDLDIVMADPDITVRIAAIRNPQIRSKRIVRFFEAEPQVARLVGIRLGYPDPLSAAIRVGWRHDVARELYIAADNDAPWDQFELPAPHTIAALVLLAGRWSPTEAFAA